MTAGITNATGARLEFASTDLPSGSNASSNAVGATLTISSDAMSPSPQQNAAGAQLLPAFPPTDEVTIVEPETVSNQWVIQ